MDKMQSYAECLRVTHNLFETTLRAIDSATTREQIDLIVHQTYELLKDPITQFMLEEAARDAK